MPSDLSTPAPCAALHFTPALCRLPLLHSALLHFALRLAQELRDLFKLEPSECESSKTQRELHAMHAHQVHLVLVWLRLLLFCLQAVLRAVVALVAAGAPICMP